MPQNNGFQRLLDRFLGREDRAEVPSLADKFNILKNPIDPRIFIKNTIFNTNKEILILKEKPDIKTIFNKPLYNNIINDGFLDRLYNDHFLRRNNNIIENVIPLNQFDLLNGGGDNGYLSAHNGKIFNAAELEGIDVELVPISAEEEFALFDAHKRFIERSAAKVADDYKKKTGETMDNLTAGKVEMLVALKVQHRQSFGTEDIVTSIREGKLDQEISSLRMEQHFSSMQLAQIKISAEKRTQTETHAALFAQGSRRYFKINATGCGKVQKQIEDILQSKGYTVLDYQNGIATETAEGRHGKQQFKIGKLLKDNQELLDAYAKDPLRTLNGLMVVLSNDPMDIAMMSTNRGWRSCMSHDGVNFHYVYEDIRAGTIVSYLTSVTDPMIHNPLSRVSLKPFKETSNSLLSAWRGQASNTIFRPGPNYGIPNAVFYKALQQFAATKMNAGKEGTFELTQGLYQDGMRRRVTRSKPLRLKNNRSEYAGSRAFL